MEDQTNQKDEYCSRALTVQLLDYYLFSKLNRVQIQKVVYDNCCSGNRHWQSSHVSRREKDIKIMRVLSNLLSELNYLIRREIDTIITIKLFSSELLANKKLRSFKTNNALSTLQLM